MADEVKATVEIEETPVEGAEEQRVTVDDATEAGLSAEEIAMGKESGDIIDEKPEEKDEAEEGDDKKEEKKPEVKKEAKDEDDEEDPEIEAEKVKDYTPNEKAQYFQRKKERIKRQKAERRAELTEIRLKAAEEKIELLKSGKKVDDLDDLDAELDAELDGDEGNDDDIVTKGDLRRAEEKKAQEKKAREEKAKTLTQSLDVRYREAREENANFDALCDLAGEVMEEDQKEGGTYSLKMVQLASDPEGDIAGYITKLAKLHDRYGEVSKGKTVKTGKEGKESANKIINNASKRMTSAAVGGGNGRRIVSEDDLTVQDAAKLSDEAYAKLSPATRERLLKS
jgi:hypothetical protein